MSPGNQKSPFKESGEAKDREDDFTKEPEGGIMCFEDEERSHTSRNIGGLLKVRVARKQIILKRRGTEGAQPSSRRNTALPKL